MAAWARALVAGRGAGDAHDLRERVEEAAPLLEEAGNVYHLAVLFANAASCALRRAFDADAALYLQRAVPLVRQIDQPFISMMLREKVGLAALFSHDTHAARDAFHQELALSHELVASHITSQALTGLEVFLTQRDGSGIRLDRVRGPGGWR
jgi:Tfp pilus assembly protein PilF